MCGKNYLVKSKLRKLLFYFLLSVLFSVGVSTKIACVFSHFISYVSCVTTTFTFLFILLLLSLFQLENIHPVVVSFCWTELTEDVLWEQDSGFLNHYYYQVYHHFYNNLQRKTFIVWKRKRPICFSVYTLSCFWTYLNTARTLHTHYRRPGGLVQNNSNLCFAKREFYFL